MNVFFSNRVENLFELLKRDLFLPKQSPFSNRLVVVPSPAVKTWLTQQIAKDFNIAMGVQISYLEQTLASLRYSTEEMPSLLALSLAIEHEIRQVHKEQKDPETWLPLWYYLGSPTASRLTKKGERRLVSISETLASLFQQYGIYGASLVKEWEQEESGGWQAALWHQLFCSDKYPWSFPIKEYGKAPRIPQRDTALYLFSMSYLPKIHHQFLLEAAKTMPIRYYLLSPCQEFWSDILSDTESGRLQTYWERRGISDEQQHSLEEYLSDRNPLLANYGIVGREMAKTLEESEVETDSYYHVNEGGKVRILDAIQTDLAHMRNSEEEEPPVIIEGDDSIQVHMATNHIREVEVVHGLILRMIEKHQMLPEEIIVMAPHIGEYAPSIKYVFEGANLDYQLMDLSTPLHHSAVQAFLNLIDLPFGRWDVVSFLELLESPPFREKRAISMDEFEQISYWLRETGVRWGEDAEHREQLLQRDHGGVTLIEKSAKGTWDDALGRLLNGLVDQDEGLIVASQGELLGKLIHLLQSLKRDLRPLYDGTKMSLERWAVYLKELAEEYFHLDEEAQSILIGQIDQFQRVAKDITVSFSSIQKRLKGLLQKQQGGYRESHLHAIRFCSMLPMRAIPARAIILMGMQEGVFPKKGQNLSLNQCLQHPDKVDFCPSVADYDRFLFLEALLSARDYLYFTYQGISLDDGKEQPPNALLKELIHYIENAYSQPVPIHRHSPFGFAENQLFSHLHYEEAVAYYKKEKKAPHRFIKGIQVAPDEERVIDIKELNQFAKNPLKLYLNNTLKFYLKHEEEAPTGEEDFQLSHLQRFLIKKEALQHTLDVVFDIAEKRRMLPEGVFKEIEKKKILEEIKIMSIPNQIFTVTLSEDCEEPTVDEMGCWTTPPVEVEGGFSIVGTFPEVSEEGLFVFHKADKTDVIKAWPGYLVFHEAVKKYQLPIGTNIQFGKDGKMKSPFFEESREHLMCYCDYFNLCKQEASPLLPEWVYSLLYEDETKLQKKIEKILPNYDLYLNWLYRGHQLPNALEIKDKWYDKARTLYAELLENWGK